MLPMGRLSRHLLTTAAPGASDGGVSHNGFEGDMPLWVPLALLAVTAAGVLLWGLLFRLLWREVRQLIRGRRECLSSLCTSCGYDLRASPERCPECGTAAVATATK